MGLEKKYWKYGIMHASGWLQNTVKHIFDKVLGTSKVTF